MRRLLALLLLLTLPVAACASEDAGRDDAGLPDEGDAAQVDTAEGDGGEDTRDGAPSSQMVSCENPEAGYRLEYPDNYHVASGQEVTDCSVFAAGEVRLEDAESVDTAAIVVIRLEPVSLEEAAAQEGLEVLSTVPTQVAGREAQVVEARVTEGHPSLEQGWQVAMYLVPISEQETLVASVNDFGNEPDYQSRRQLLDQMMSSLEFTEEARQGEPETASPTPSATASEE